jgi:sulfatase modifying factor 1
MPAPGSGKHIHINGGNGLLNADDEGGTTYEPGWLASDNAKISPTTTNLLTCDNYATWTSSVVNNENLPINCVNWWEAYAFCIWDGGFLPSEAEWEYAAAGGDQQRPYPWGSLDPGTANQYAIYGNNTSSCYYPGPGLQTCTGVADFAPVGTATLGVGRWGQVDLVGNVWEWTMDEPSVLAYPDPCTDCVELASEAFRAIMGGCSGCGGDALVPSGENVTQTSNRGRSIGFRCARIP